MEETKVEHGYYGESEFLYTSPNSSETGMSEEHERTLNQWLKKALVEVGFLRVASQLTTPQF